MSGVSNIYRIFRQASS